MRRIEQLKNNLKPGTVYRRSDLAQWSKNVDRHAREPGRVHFMHHDHAGAGNQYH